MAREKRANSRARRRAKRRTAGKRAPKRAKKRGHVRASKRASKRARVRAANAWAGYLIGAQARQKLKTPKEDPRAALKFAAEFVLVVVLSLGIYVYFDPEINVIPAPLNLVLFAAVILLLIFMHFFRF